MKRFIEGEDRNQSTLFPECLEDHIAEDNPVRVIDVFVDGLGIREPDTIYYRQVYSVAHRIATGQESRI